METLILMGLGTLTALAIAAGVAGRSQNTARRRAAANNDSGAGYVSTGDGCDAGDAGCDGGGGDGGGGGGD